MLSYKCRLHNFIKTIRVSQPQNTIICSKTILLQYLTQILEHLSLLVVLNKEILMFVFIIYHFLVLLYEIKYSFWFLRISNILLHWTDTCHSNIWNNDTSIRSKYSRKLFEVAFLILIQNNFIISAKVLKYYIKFIDHIINLK